MDEDWIDKLDAAVAEVFALMLGRNCSPAGSVEAAAGYAAAVEFSGTLCGQCTVQVAAEGAVVLTEELTGQSTPELCRDTVGELCNMIAGSWKSRLPGAHSTCVLSVPRAAPHTPPRTFDGFYRTYQAQEMSLTLSLKLA